MPSQVFRKSFIQEGVPVSSEKGLKWAGKARWTLGEPEASTTASLGLLAHDPVAVSVAHVAVSRMAAPDRRNAVAPRFLST